MAGRSSPVFGMSIRLCTAFKWEDQCKQRWRLAQEG